MISSVVFLLAVAISTAGPLNDLQRAQRQIYTQAGPSVVLVGSETGFGSGFVVDQEGHIITNKHVVADVDIVDIVRFDGQRLKGAVVSRASDIDLALLQVPDIKVQAIRLGRPQEVQVGSWIASIGHGAGECWTFTTNMISNVYPMGPERAVFQTQVHVSPGNSGGPLVNVDGDVLGVVTAGLPRAETINFAIRVDEIWLAFPQLPPTCGCLVVTGPPDVPLFLDGVHMGVGPSAFAWPSDGRHEVSSVIDGAMTTQHVTYPDVRTVNLNP